MFRHISTNYHCVCDYAGMFLQNYPFWDEHFKTPRLTQWQKPTRKSKWHVTPDSSDHIGEIPHRSIRKTAMNSTGVDPNSCLECQNRGGIGRLKNPHGGCFLLGEYHQLQACLQTSTRWFDVTFLCPSWSKPPTTFDFGSWKTIPKTSRSLNHLVSIPLTKPMGLSFDWDVLFAGCFGSLGWLDGNLLQALKRSPERA